MKLGMVGLGRMGGSMAIRLMRGGHQVVAYSIKPEEIEEMEKEGAIGAYSIGELCINLSSPRIVWLMIPAGKPVEETIEELLLHLEEGDIIIDGGNSNYKDTLRRTEKLVKRRINFIDVGTSGGVWGLEDGYCMMIGGEERIVDQLRPVFETLAPSPDKGWGRVGSNGSGHFVKMVHNGIEYALMESYAEGFAIMQKKKKFRLDLHKIAEIWRFGSVIRSWLLDLASQALADDQSFDDIAPYVEDSGEGRWTVFESIDLDVAAPVITLALLQRLKSRDEKDYSDRLLAVLRRQFGGHQVKRKK